MLSKESGVPADDFGKRRKRQTWKERAKQNTGHKLEVQTRVCKEKMLEDLM